jgi:hypothetical protein
MFDFIGILTSVTEQSDMQNLFRINIVDRIYVKKRC